jgi:YfiH family protein
VERESSGTRLGLTGTDRATELAGIVPPGLGHAWVKQVHSAIVLSADGPGRAGEGDAVITRETGLALSVVTADCVPVLVAAGGWIAAIHAGWRGIAAGVVQATVERLRAEGAGPARTAWIGPAIGGCCYEVGPEVAEAVAAASTPDAILAWPGSARPHLDLLHAVRTQLEAAGLTDVHPLVACTRCDTARLHSYRRDGNAAGRNLAVIWKTARAGGAA